MKTLILLACAWVLGVSSAWAGCAWVVWHEYTLYSSRELPRTHKWLDVATPSYEACMSAARARLLQFVSTTPRISLSELLPDLPSGSGVIYDPALGAVGPAGGVDIKAYVKLPPDKVVIFDPVDGIYEAVFGPNKVMAALGDPDGHSRVKYQCLPDTVRP